MIKELEEKIGYKFKDKNLLITALTHTSYANEKNTQSNEKLEFLGDAILEFVISRYLYSNYLDLKEGEMTKVRASVVCEESLYKIARMHNFSDFLNLGKSEIINKGHTSQSILADSVESVIAAMYLDGGIDNTEEFIINNLKEEIEIASKNVGMKDYKTVLQEILQAKGEVIIEYEVLNQTGPDHDKSFQAGVKVNKNLLAKGLGKSKKQAEMEAARLAISKIQKS